MFGALSRFFGFGNGQQQNEEDGELQQPSDIPRKEEEELFFVELDKILDRISSQEHESNENVSIDYSIRNDRLTIKIDKLRDSLKQTFFCGDANNDGGTTSTEKSEKFSISDEIDNLNESIEYGKQISNKSFSKEEQFNKSIDDGSTCSFNLACEEKSLDKGKNNDFLVCDSQHVGIGVVSINEELPIVVEQSPNSNGKNKDNQQNELKDPEVDEDQQVPIHHHVEFSFCDDDNLAPNQLVDIDKLLLSCGEKNNDRNPSSLSNPSIFENSYVVVDICHSICERGGENQKDESSTNQKFSENVVSNGNVVVSNQATPTKTQARTFIIDSLVDQQQKANNAPMSPLERPILPNMGLEFPSSPIRTRRTRKRKILEEKKLANDKYYTNEESRKKTLFKTRINFTEEEEKYIIQGVEKYGTGKWVQIVQEYPFHGSRTNVDIKDKYRTMKNRGDFD